MANAGSKRSDNLMFKYIPYSPGVKIMFHNGGSKLIKLVSNGNLEKIKSEIVKKNFQTSCKWSVRMHFHNCLVMDPIRNVKLEEKGQCYEAHFQITNNLNQT